mmetsp:Transcript_272/g.446  ORF Transcript_272/g.446 Transcript_272/m.446 type:complete len:236 (+) Transcript_272:134-841(+)
MSVLLPLYPLSGVHLPIGEADRSIASPLIIRELAFVDLAIFVDHLSMTTHLAVIPLALEDSSIGERAAPVSMPNSLTIFGTSVGACVSPSCRLRNQRYDVPEILSSVVVTGGGFCGNTQFQFIESLFNLIHALTLKCLTKLHPFTELILPDLLVILVLLCPLPEAGRKGVHAHAPIKLFLSFFEPFFICDVDMVQDPLDDAVGVNAWAVPQEISVVFHVQHHSVLTRMIVASSPA